MVPPNKTVEFVQFGCKINLYAELRRQVMRFSLDVSYALSANIGDGGLGDSELDALKPVAEKVMRDIIVGREKGEPLFLELPYYRDQADKALKWAQSAKESFDTFVLLGIGGSALGPRALIDALCHPLQATGAPATRKGMRVFVCDNVDPAGLSAILDVVDLKRTVFNVVSKSGGTAEVIALFMAVHDRLEKALGRDGLKKNVIFTTDPQKGPLRKLANEGGFTSFDIPPAVGGRYSVLTSVGLVPAAAGGIDVMGLLNGAEKIDHACRLASLDNPALMFATLMCAFHMKKGRNILVMMPYSNGLLTMAEWFQQLWAESLGKKFSLDGKVVNAGSTPVRALGATDQHSQLQLYMEGPHDKVIVFLRVEEHNYDIKIPPVHIELEDFGYLAGHSLGELLNAEQSASAQALAENSRPNITLSMDKLNAETVGGLFYFLELATAIAGGIYNVNPYDQPGVELGKKLTYGKMGRKGYEKKAIPVKVRRELLFPSL